ncbi:MAG: protein kinase [Cyanobium sp. CZS 25K]|nr:protein kinase [Cyanobium sp. CZS25K]
MTQANAQKRRLKVIVFSDVVDSSAQIFADELIAIQRIKEDLTMIGEILKRHGGSLVKSLGDGILATFDSPTQALEFVEDVVIRISRRGQNSLQHRFGLHTGEIYLNGDDIIGQGVHLASRLQTTAPVNGVAFVQSTFELIDYRFQIISQCLLRPVQLKGLPMAVICYTIEAHHLIGTKGSPSHSEIDLEGLLSATPYRLERPLGTSPKPSTYLVRETNRNRKAVLKVIPCDATNLDALQVEATCLDRLRHPHVPRFVDGFAHHGAFLFLEEYIAGASLQGSLDFLRRKQRLAKLLRHVLKVLEVIHAAGILHGDLHPSNLIPSDDGQSVFVVNFNLLKAQTSGAPVGGKAQTGRPFFSPPERVQFGDISSSGDLYALGVLCLSLYTGQTPEERFERDQGRWRLDDLDPEVAGWLAPMLEESPAKRVASATDALQLLDRPQVPSSADDPTDLHGAPLPPLAKLDGPIRKAALQHSLAATYGPVVALLLERFPSTIPLADVQGLRQRLVTAGLSPADLDQALEESAAPTTPEQPINTLRENQPSRPPSAAQVAAWQAALRTQLAEMIGPIAEVLCTQTLFEALMGDLPAARRMLVASAIPSSVVEALLDQAERTRPAAGRSTGAGPSDPSPDAPQASAVPSDTQLREPLLDLIGAIGNPLLDSLAHLPMEERPDALIQTLEGYGVDPGTIAELRRRWGETSAT